MVEESSACVQLRGVSGLKQQGEAEGVADEVYKVSTLSTVVDAGVVQDDDVTLLDRARETSGEEEEAEIHRIERLSG